MGPLGAMADTNCLSVEMQFYHVPANISPMEEIIKQWPAPSQGLPFWCIGDTVDPVLTTETERRCPLYSTLHVRQPQT